MPPENNPNPDAGQGDNPDQKAPAKPKARQMLRLNSNQKGHLSGETFTKKQAEESGIDAEHFSAFKVEG